jgi:hypothetical protein
VSGGKLDAVFSTVAIGCSAPSASALKGGGQVNSREGTARFSGEQRRSAIRIAPLAWTYTLSPTNLPQPYTERSRLYTIDEGAMLTPDGADMLGLPRRARNGFELPARDLADLRDGLCAVVDEEATE